MPSSSAIEAVVHYRKKLERHMDDPDPSVMLHCLSKLDRVPMTIDILQETGVGKLVNSLKKKSAPDSDVASKAKAIVRKWKDLVASHEETEDGNDVTADEVEPDEESPAPPAPPAAQPPPPAAAELAEAMDDSEDEKPVEKESRSRHHHKSSNHS